MVRDCQACAPPQKKMCRTRHKAHKRLAFERFTVSSATSHSGCAITMMSTTLITPLTTQLHIKLDVSSSTSTFPSGIVAVANFNTLLRQDAPSKNNIIAEPMADAMCDGHAFKRRCEEHARKTPYRSPKGVCHSLMQWLAHPVQDTASSKEMRHDVHKPSMRDILSALDSAMLLFYSKSDSNVCTCAKRVVHVLSLVFAYAPYSHCRFQAAGGRS